MKLPGIVIGKKQTTFKYGSYAHRHLISLYIQNYESMVGSKNIMKAFRTTTDESPNITGVLSIANDLAITEQFLVAHGFVPSDKDREKVREAIFTLKKNCPKAFKLIAKENAKRKKSPKLTSKSDDDKITQAFKKRNRSKP
jgi:hypothetical protein